MSKQVFIGIDTATENVRAVAIDTEVIYMDQVVKS